MRVIILISLKVSTTLASIVHIHLSAICVYMGAGKDVVLCVICGTCHDYCACVYMCECSSGIHPQTHRQLHLGVQKHMHPLCCDGVTCCALKSTQSDFIFYCSRLGRRNPLSPELLQIQLPLIKLVSCLLWIPIHDSRNHRHRDHLPWRNLHSVSGWGDHITWSKSWWHFTVDLASSPVLLCYHLPSTVSSYRCQSSF